VQLDKSSIDGRIARRQRTTASKTETMNPYGKQADPRIDPERIAARTSPGEKAKKYPRFRA
jgi:hypothetical protein